MPVLEYLSVLKGNYAMLDSDKKDLDRESYLRHCEDVVKGIEFQVKDFLLLGTPRTKEDFDILGDLLNKPSGAFLSALAVIQTPQHQCDYSQAHLLRWRKAAKTIGELRTAYVVKNNESIKQRVQA